MAVIKGITVVNVGAILMILYCCIFFVEDPSGDVCRAPGTNCNTESVAGDSRLKVNAGMERAVPDSDTDSPTCGPRGHSRRHPRDWRSPGSLDCSVLYFDANNISRMVCAFTELCLGFTCSFSDQEEDVSRNSTKEKHGFGVATVVDDSLPSPGGDGLPYFPDLFRSFLYYHTGRQSQGNVIVAALYFIGIVIYILTVLLAIICKNENYEAMKHTENTIILKFLCFKFSVKWQRNRMQWNQKNILPRKFKKQCSFSDNIHQSSSTFFHYQNSVMNILNEHIFHPLRSRFRVENTESSSDNPGRTDCHCVKDSVFSECHEHYDNFFNPNLVTVQAYPVTRFLPNLTFNPDIDLSHVGYRLATLNALPSSVPVSRVRLADAGFYFRGHSDEVMCYSCHVRVSDWSRGGDLMDIHRALSPRCEHVLARDRELAALATGTNQGVPVNAARNEGRRQSRRSLLSATSENSHVEDSEGSAAEEPPEHSGTATSSSLPVPSQRSPFRPGLSSTDGSEGPGTSMAACAPAVSGFSSHSQTSSLTVNSAGGGSQHPGVTGNSASGGSQHPGVTGNSASGGSQHPGVTGNSASGGSQHVLNSAGGGSRHVFPQSRLELGQAVYPMYQSMSSRRRTFTVAWNDGRAPPLEEVLMSGMFYAGYADCVRCFFCGVGLKNWERTDNVWTEHVRWRPHCHYLRTIKGDHFIRATQRQLGVMSATSEDRPTAQRSSQDQGSHNSQDQGSHNSQDQGSHNSQDQGSHNSQDQGSHNSQDQGSHNSQDQGSHNSQDQGSHNSQDQGSHNSQDQGSHNSEDQGSHNSQDQGSHNPGSSPPPTTASSSGISATTMVQPTSAAVLTSASSASFSATSASFSATSVTAPPATTNSTTAVSIGTAAVPTTSAATPNTVAGSGRASSLPTTSTATANTSVAVSGGTASVPVASTATPNTSAAGSGRAASVPTTATANTSAAVSGRAASVPTTSTATANTSAAVSGRAASVPTTSTATANTSAAAGSGRAASVSTTSTATANTSAAAGSGRAASVSTTSTATANTSAAGSGGTASVPSTSSAVISPVPAPGRTTPVPGACQSGSVAAPPTPIRAAAAVALSALASRVVDQAEARRGGGGDWRGGGGGDWRGRGRGGGQGGVGVHDERVDQDRLARLQEDNRQMSQRLRCRVCNEAAIDTILMPCGHLVVCAACATTVTLCPLCHFSIRATAHVFLDN